MKKILSFLVVLALPLGVFAKDKTFNIKLSILFKPTEILTQSIQKVAKRIKTKTHGTINIQVFHSGQLPVYKANVEQVVSGSNWIAIESPETLGDYVPDFRVLVGPMLYKNYTEYEKMMKTKYVAGLVKKAEKEGIHVLSLSYLYGFRSLITNKVIKTPADLKGMKLRVPNSPLFINTLKAMGANPSPIPFTEVYSGIQQGVVDGLEGTIPTLYGTKIYEVTKVMSETNHLIGSEGAYISPKLWNKLSSSQRKIIQDEFNKGATENNNIVRKADSEYKVKLKKLGVTFNDVDNESFSKGLKSVFASLPNVSADAYDKVKAEIRKIRN